MINRRVFVLHQGKEYGPFSIRELSNRHLTADMLAREVDSEVWQPIGNVEPLRRLVRYGPRSRATAVDADLGENADPPVIAVHDLAVDYRGTRIITDVSFAVMPGEMVAIMGNSGCGKSTLLSAMGGHAVPSRGRVIVDGCNLYEYPEPARHRIAFVPQRDHANPLLTVRQTMLFSARWRLPRATSDAEVAFRVDELITRMGLESTEQLPIGSDGSPGISGGQRKRLAIAIEMLMEPSILLLDEPTSGLSSTDAFAIVSLLARLADAGTTVIASVHQPSLEVVRAFDAIAVLARDDSTDRRGRLVWFGRAWPDTIEHFEPRAAGAPEPVSADGLLRGLAGRSVSEWVADWTRSGTRRNWVDSRLRLSAASEKDRRPPSRAPTDRMLQWWTLVRRTVAVKVADRTSAWLLFAQPLVVGVIVACVFANTLGRDVSVENWLETAGRVGTATFLVGLAAVWFGCSSSAREYVEERPLFRHERRAGLSLSAYVASKIAVLGGVTVIQSTLLLVVLEWLCRLETPIGKLWLVMASASLAGMSIGLLISSLAKTAESATAMLPLALIPMIVLGGGLVAPRELPLLVQPVSVMMPSRWSFEAIMLEESSRRPRLQAEPPEIVRAEPDRDPGGKNDQKSKSDDMAEQFFPAKGVRVPLWTCTTLLGAIAFFGFALGVLVVWFKDLIATTT